MPVTDAPAKARALYDARRTRVPIPPFTDADPTLGMADGYAIQRELIDLLLADGDRIVGHKVGLTSKPMQQMVGVDSPDYGPVLASTIYRDGDTIPVSRFIAPKIEAEIVFVIGERLEGPGVTVTQAHAAIAGAVAAMEIVDSRIADWAIGFTDTVADNASSGLFVVGSEGKTLDELEPVDVTMSLTIDGEERSAGNGAACLGDPLEALRWLAVQAYRFGDPLRAGHLILSGALGPFVPFAPGDRVETTISGFAPLSVTFEEQL